MEWIMNKKMKMFIICTVFVLIISCKNYTSGEDLKSSEQNLEILEQFVKKSEQEIKKQFNEVLSISETKDLNLDTAETIKKKLQELRDRIERSNAKKTSLGTYSEYEEQIKKIKEKLNGKKLDDTLREVGREEKLLKGLEESLKKKKEERKQELEEAKKKFEECKNKVESATGVTLNLQLE